jgi:hypothetical protein
MLETLKEFFWLIIRDDVASDAKSKSKERGGLPLWVCAGDISGVGVNCDEKPK